MNGGHYRVWRVTLAAGMLAIGILGCKKETASVGGGGAAAAPAPMKAYPETVEGLTELMADLNTAALDSKDAEARQIVDSLILKDAGAWFMASFGEEKGGELVIAYASASMGFVPLIGMLKAQKAKGKTEHRVEKFDKADDPNAIGYQETALKEAKAPLALYSWRATAPGKRTGQHLYNFAWAEGGWRFVGSLKGMNSKMGDDPKMDAISSLRAKDREEFFKSGALPE